MSYIVIAGDVHGAIGLFYEQAMRLQDELKEPIEAILQVGDLQVYSEESHVDKAVKVHGGPGEFPQWFKELKGFHPTTSSPGISSSTQHLEIIHGWVPASVRTQQPFWLRFSSKHFQQNKKATFRQPFCFVELKGFEPSTPTLRTSCSPS